MSTRVEDFRLEDWLPGWLGPDLFIALLTALAVVAVFVAIWQALLPATPFERRYGQILERREGLRQVAIDPRRARRQLTPGGVMSNVIGRLNLLRSTHAQHARSLLAQAGIRSNEAMIRYLFARLAMPFVFASLVFIDQHGPRILPVPERFQWEIVRA